MMYTAHFGLSQAPFGITPDTGYFFHSEQAQRALNTLLVAAENGEGFIKITGEVGAGKTILCRKFMASLPDKFITAYIPNPMLEPMTLMLALADELEIELAPGVDQHKLLKAINLRLLHLAREGKNVILCIDEAQAIPQPSLEALRLLTNLETEKRKLLQIVLFGQPELDQNLAQKEIRQLTQRITFHYHLGALSYHDLSYYIAHRLSVAGYNGAHLFSAQALKRLYKTSGGIPRLVNIIAHKALMLGYGEGRRQISARHIAAAARDTITDTLSARRQFWQSRQGIMLVVIFALVIALCIALLLGYGRVVLP